MARTCVHKGACAAQVEGHVDHLASMQMTLELLQETSVGRIVKRISKRREPELAAASAKARHALSACKPFHYT